MAQLAQVFRFRVRPMRQPDAPWRLLGDIDEAGTRLVDVLPAAFSGTAYERDIDGHSSPQPVVTFEAALPVVGADRVGATFNHHEYGSHGLLNRVAQGDSLPFTGVDNQQVQVSALATAPPEPHWV